MTSQEYTEYDRLTKGMEADFLILTPRFMGYCEDVIFGEEREDLRYYCFHIYHDSYLSHIYQKLSNRILKIHNQVDALKFPNLSNGLANLLIYLKEPISRENDAEYKELNYKYWRKEVGKDPVLQNSGSFKKYLR